ncbi:MAG: glutathione S-transferase family protein [Rhizobiaceae bacterium]
MIDRPRLFGADYSVYVRIARLALSEKGIDYDHIPVDIFDRDNVPDWYLERHPFKRIPAFQHGELRLFETSAITRYVDEAFDGPALQPVDAAARAAMNQTISLLDAGDRLTLADLYAAPMIACFVQADEGRAMLDTHPRLTAWWSRMEARASFEETRPTST